MRKLGNNKGKMMEIWLLQNSNEILCQNEQSIDLKHSSGSQKERMKEQTPIDAVQK